MIGMQLTLSEAELKRAIEFYLSNRWGMKGKVNAILLRRKSSKTENVGSVVVNVLSLGKEREMNDNSKGRSNNKRSRR